MKKICVAFVGSIIFLSTKCQSVVGDWEGALAVSGTELPVVFHIKKDSSNQLTATFDSPRQKAFNLAFSGVQVKEDSLILSMAMIHATYAGQLNTAHNALTGTWSQNSKSLPLNMKKTSDVATSKELKRPQTPKPPFSYHADDVSYFNADRSIQFGGTITWPKEEAVKRYPVVILITGSGKQDRDETIFGHKPFAIIADYLAVHGIAVLRVDDRTMGATTGNFQGATTADFAHDVEAGIQYLKTLSFVDTSKIGLVGHSEGGIIAPLVAGRRKDIKFIVMLAGPGMPITDLMEDQNVDMLMAAGISKEHAEQYRPLYKHMIAVLMEQTDSATALKKMTTIFNEWQNKTDNEVVLHLTGVSDEAKKAEFLKAFATEVRSPWFNYFIRIKPATYLSKVTCPVLALNGEKDIQVSAKPNLAALKTALPQNSKTEIIELPGLNHLFQHCIKCSVDEYSELEESFAPEALAIMAKWIKTVTQ